jgi:hypothetical protein
VCEEVWLLLRRAAYKFPPFWSKNPWWSICRASNDATLHPPRYFCDSHHLPLVYDNVGSWVDEWRYNYLIFKTITWSLDGTSRFELPSQFDNFTVIAERFREYKNDHYYYITTVFICAYLYKQTFAIPGSFLLVCFHIIIIKQTFSEHNRRSGVWHVERLCVGLCANNLWIDSVLFVFGDVRPRVCAVLFWRTT